MSQAGSPLTDQQHRAVHCRDASVVLSSGAGCGKTYVLTERYLAHLRDDGAEVGQIVAITFTERAAREMRSRIRAAVLRHVKAATSDAEAETWARHLRGLETAQISTIHAYCASLLRQHAVEAGLDPHFSVLEDVLSVNLEAEALTACLQRLLTEETEAGEDLRQLVLLFGWNTVVRTVEALMAAWDEQRWEGWFRQSAQEVVAGWQELARQSLLPRYLDYLTAGPTKMARCLTLLRATPPLLGSQMAGRVRLLLEETPRLAATGDLASAIERLCETAKVTREYARAWPSSETYEAAKDALEGFRTCLASTGLEQFIAPPEGTVEAAVVGRRLVSVVREAVAAYRQLKRQNGVVDFQDLLVMARDLLRDHGEVRERLQRRTRYLLIDELQDTDPVQMELVEYLCGARLTAGKLFTVGDQKQSIYRFRGADVHLFQELRQSVPHEGRLGLTLNFRSQPAILHFVNALFAERLRDYEPLEAHLPQVHAGPCVEFLWNPRQPKEHVAEARSHEAEMIARRITCMIGREEVVVQQEKGTYALRPVQPADVVLLFRAMSNVHLYEQALREQGLDYYLVGGRAFFAQQEIYDLLNLLRALENPHDALSLAGTLRSPFCCLNDEALFVLGQHGKDIWAGLHDPAVYEQVPEEQRAAVARARRFLDHWRAQKDRLPIATLLGVVFADSGYDAATQVEFLGDRKLANLWKLMEMARAFDRSGLFGLAEFIRRLGDLVRNQPREEQAATQPENADVVRLMSIHQAKGLEFPVVIVPDVAAERRDSQFAVAEWDPRLGCVVRAPGDQDPPPFSDFGWELWKAQEQIEDWHEDLRTLYVACTRARDYLILSGSLQRPYGPTNAAWTQLLAERFDLTTGRCLAADLPTERVPQVRLLDGPEALPQLPVRSQRTEKRAHFPRTDDLTNVAPIPVRLCSKRIFTQGEVEWLLRRQPVADHGGIRAEDVSEQFDTEDGSDRTAWSAPRQHLLRAVGSAALLDAALARWDFQDPNGWRVALQQALESVGMNSTSAPWRAEVETEMERLAASGLCDQLAAATVCYRDMEFILRGTGAGQGPCVRGLIDFLWQDSAGAWHLLALARGSDPGERTARRQALALAVHALRDSLGVSPQRVSFYFLEDGTAECGSASSLGDEFPTAALDSAFTAIGLQALSD
jgi:ATP-dependent helicase/nuclease subunit A